MTSRRSVLTRSPTADQLRRLAQLHEAAFAPARGWTTAEIADLARSGSLIADPAERGFAIVSCAADEAELLTIVVAREERGRGLGAVLLHEALRAAAMAGATRLFLEVAEANEPARRLYAGAGFEEIGRRKAYYGRGEDRIDALLLARSVSDADLSA